MKLALAGDTMLGRGVAELLASSPPESLFATEVVETIAEADLCILNLECCISERGVPAPRRRFHFRAPPAAVDALVHLGVDCVTLANNHALDYGPVALMDTFAHLETAGIAWVGAGVDADSARAPRLLEANGFRLRVLGMTDHPREDAAAAEQPGVAFADLSDGNIPSWVRDASRREDCDAILSTPHWGPNMAAEPVVHVLEAAAELVDAGASLVAGHSAHVFHGVASRVLYDLGDFLDDYRVNEELRNDLGLLFLVDLAGTQLEAVPLKLDFAHTRLARGDDAALIRRRFTAACAAFGTEVVEEDGRLVAAWR